jgi:membrane-bound serine protease (ClpP class)
MNRFRLCLALLTTFLGTLPANATAAADPQQGFVALITVHDTLQPVRARSFAHDIAAANRSGATAILVNFSTPGGMASATDTMVGAIRTSHAPVIVWAGLEQSRIGGEGLRLLQEADVALMSDTTHLSPLWTNPPRGLTAAQRDAGSRALAAQLSAAVAQHHRNPAAVQNLAYGQHWLNSAEALQAGIIDGVNNKMETVLQAASGHMVTRDGKTFPLELQGLPFHQQTTEGEDLLLLSLMNPNLDVLLLALGLLLIYLEINTPGIVVPGATGVLLMLITAFALGSLPVSKGAIALCVLALILMVAEARFRTRGFFAAAGILALIVGLGTLVSGPIAELQVAWKTAIGAGIGFGGVTVTLMILGMEAKRTKVKTGADAMLGWLAVAQTPLAPTGRILVRGELWDARLTTQDASVAAGDKVKVLRIDGTTLEVTAVPLTHSA